MSDRGVLTKKEFYLRWSRGDLLFVLAVVLLSLFKYRLAAVLPISPRPGYRTDDFLMVWMTRNLLKNNWLGPYGDGVLMKGCFYPLFLAAVHWLGLSYLGTLDILNTLAALYFVHCVRVLLPKKWQRLILFVILLFDPVTLGQFTFGRIYRNSITNMQVLFLFGTYFSLYLEPERKQWKQLVMLLFGGFILWGFWNTREDSIWAAPFILTATVLLIISGLRGTGRSDRRRFLTAAGKRAVICLLPVFMLMIGNQVITQINRSYYGKPVRLETESVFGDLLKTIYSIKNEEDRKWTTVTGEKLERMYSVSPSLMSIKPELDQMVESLDPADGEKADGDVEDGWFFWAFRRAVGNAGKADSLPEAEQFYQAVQAELDAAIKKPDSPFQTQPVMPSPLMSPWRKGYFKELLSDIGRAALYLASFTEVSAKPRTVPLTQIGPGRMFEGITNNSFILDDLGEGGNDILREYKTGYVDRADRVIGIYQILNGIVALAAVLLYLFLTMAFLFRRKWQHVPFILTLTGMFLSLLVMLTGIAYTELTAFNGITYTYLSGGYPLMLAFEGVVILYAADLVRKRVRNHSAE